MSDPRPEAPELREAAAWHARLGNRSISTQALRDFRDWRSVPANDAAYQAVEQAWARSQRLASDPEILRTTEAMLTRPRRRFWPPPRPALWALAVAAVAIPLLALLSVRLGDPLYRTGVGEQRLVRLADGSRLHLNTDSQARVAFDRGTRRLVLLRGEAFFDVAHDAARPFVVEAGDARVRALGTRFGVRRVEHAVQVTLLEGAVKVAVDEGHTWALAPNQEVTVTANGGGQVRVTDAALDTSWTTGRLHFRSTPLAEAVAEVNRYADRKVELRADGLAARPVSGVFDVGDTDAFVHAVSALFDLRVEDAEGGPIRLAVGAGRAG
ncbi:FecR family protein [Phenylobacterium sp.]|jgi:transmembrane sensor|uniref:FecR family protein n=1 Tax=Phenylobacterium sp. TaxID=1871053 RepID=UPI002F91E8FB